MSDFLIIVLTRFIRDDLSEGLVRQSASIKFREMSLIFSFVVVRRSLSHFFFISRNLVHEFPPGFLILSLRPLLSTKKVGLISLDDNSCPT